ncbi:MAG: hypothetical protein CVU28_00345 [Betaproteobacteria bacterium HGW-Betaproteobacteria-21]|nr:MAG: hypothetical protein CVU28_00345 [Betaproteobacteria bacterium HGW-Betaproteobacteria-21]
MIRPSPITVERAAILILAVAAGLLLFAPSITQPQSYHQLADTRALSLGLVTVPNAADVLSSLLFTVAGLAGLCLCKVSEPSQRLSLRVFFSGLALTGFGSVWYHLSPSDETLVWDRLPMALAFAGAVGAIAAERLGASAGARWLVGWLVLAIGSVAVWVVTGDLRLYGLAQFGGVVVLLLWVRFRVVAGMVRLPWGWLLIAYVVAKGFELFDREIWVLTEGVVAGHALKHAAAAVGVVPMLGALWRGAR